MIIPLDKYRDQLMKEISAAINGQTAALSQQEKNDMSFRTTLTLIYRLITVRMLIETKRLNIADDVAKEIILGQKDFKDSDLLKLLPVNEVLPANCLKSIDLLYEQLKKINVNSILHRIIGELYQSSQNKQVRSSLGQYFTEKKYVDLILERIPLKEDSKILEPSIGGGSFLVEIIKRINKNASAAESEELFNKITRNIYGLDIDNFCVHLSALNIHFSQNMVSLKPLNLINADFLTYQFSEKFDVIIGNPPYNARLDRSVRELMKKRYPEITASGDGSAGTLNTAALFLRKSIDLLKANGWLGFVIPNSILRVNGYKKLRRYLLRHCTVKSIINIGKAFKDAGLEMVIIILQKKAADDGQTVEIISKFTETKTCVHHMRYEYLTRWDIFPIYINDSLGQIATQIEKETVPLGELCTMPRGLGLSSKSSLLSNNPFDLQRGNIPVLRGQDIGQYIIHPPELSVNEEQKAALFNSKLPLYQSSKILVQNVAKRVVAAYDHTGYCVLDTINMLILQPQYGNKFSYYYLLAILNSELINFYFQNTINNRSKLTIHMDKPYLGRIPIKVPPDQTVYIKKVKRLLQLHQRLNDYHPRQILFESFNNAAELQQTIAAYTAIREEIKKQINKENKELNQFIYQLYQITRKQQAEIKANLGTNPIREFSFITQFKSLIKQYGQYLDREKLAVINKTINK